ncbi:MAG: hypothetical protein JO072_00015 [Parafilimonas sp.]|nr:hypothetical protein [Parafilimonas sp.]
MTSSKKLLLFSPIIGIVIFVILYVIATLFYPGGSQVDKNSTGFSWLNNYWCNLLNKYAINGQVNTARPIAITAMLILCISLILFWLVFPKYTTVNKKLSATIKFCGSLAMATGFLLFTNINHDLITNLASGLGVIATIGVVIVLYKIAWHKLFFFGLLNFLLVALNNYVYYTKELIIYLPVVQKITFVLFLFWICAIEVSLYFKQLKMNHE